MNQLILFPDIQTYDANAQVVRFPAQQAGALIECSVTVSWLAEQQGQALVNEDAILAAFAELRFDIEDAIETLIEEEAYNAVGEIALDV
uniref:DUF1488 domain-containing protein n=1 Tax=Thaumasiovibrio occultus TaxID=1891184 RepID=UPI000B354BB9|nr:DUF1488 domain-containing protein [Thaumasiovibrio occultus]